MPRNFGPAQPLFPNPQCSTKPGPSLASRAVEGSSSKSKVVQPSNTDTQTSVPISKSEDLYLVIACSWTDRSRIWSLFLSYPERP
ncbi:serine/threonine kinase 16, isoform CRA_c [Rattus norvegicus]|uniref:Serine/threonine kinase 16, isoform CRA_c n=1 Tax=Rattus norvegicus TaxID=10116 RepID=A6JVZ8_RAT|nr:serine/threonine kinase 16, isoform CRA_c [Rattus norvegicus]